MDLQTEYTRRHNLEIIVGSPDSYFLFKSGDLLYVAMISHRPRTYSFCKECSSGNMAIEVWNINSNGMGLLSHTHISPDEDVLTKIKSSIQFKEKLEIIRYENENQIITEIWKAIGNKGKNTRKEMYESVRKDEGQTANLALVFSTITYRKHPLLFDATKDI